VVADTDRPCFLSAAEIQNVKFKMQTLIGLHQRGERRDVFTPLLRTGIVCIFHFSF
jgi:hypothetical protein